ncbi:hypothetical protein BW723_09765 [Polaribacter reichenbachii]|uniref:Nucleotidyltransferase n=1 Tax=Polaribacter reichenbachii TaxID=996801 RepID=A0A1B8U3J2_9FLAO|nr:nucleotidyltransferase family protein [Polaribacter reichenbachii]APZ46557.1 hypothetical protein BW723_09765 [Polaribacter reichenbachii]AUC17203.1 hypothetical protein BTO17_00215 [Polaribacter reichenbachii]OBY66381.1 hypothetical protein LPB301_06730 [Polaribacter reichenbachii]
MNYQETLFFVGKCLTINHIDKNKKIIEEQLQNNSIDWDAVVKISTGHFVFPALYCNLKRANFLQYIPNDLVAYMKHIAHLNKERNEKIIEQAKEINELLLANDITPIFLKGTGNLLEGLYEDIAERMVGDIDFIVAKNNYLKTIQILKKKKYAVHKDGKITPAFHWHYPKLVHPEQIGAVEVHNKILKKPFDSIFKEDNILKSALRKSNGCFLSTNYKILNAILPKIINDNLYYSYIIPLRTTYDVFLMTNNTDYKIILDNKKVYKKFNNYLSCIKLVLNAPDNIIVENTRASQKYKNSYLLRLSNSKKIKLKSNIINKCIILKKYLFMLKKSFSDKEYSEYLTKRICQWDLYKKILGLKTTS